MHDAQMRPLKVGDRVLIPAIVAAVSPGDDYCNVSVETCIGRRPDDRKEYVSAANTGVMFRANDGDLNDGVTAAFEGRFVRIDPTPPATNA